MSKNPVPKALPDWGKILSPNTHRFDHHLLRQRIVSQSLSREWKLSMHGFTSLKHGSKTDLKKNSTPQMLAALAFKKT
jgi:hypothetical protein